MLSNVTIGRRLTLGFAIVIGLLLLLAALAFVRLQDLNEHIRMTNADRYPKIVLVHQIKDELNEMARNMRNLLLLSAPAVLNVEYANIEQSNRDIGAAFARLDKLIVTSGGGAFCSTPSTSCAPSSSRTAAPSSRWPSVATRWPRSTSW